jgi:hypothetical protein
MNKFHLDTHVPLENIWLYIHVMFLLKFKVKFLNVTLEGVLVVNDLVDTFSNPKWTYIQSEIYQTYKFIHF